MAHSIRRDIVVTSRAVPVASSQRLFALDAIRGCALLGILIMNMPAFNTSFYAGAGGTRPFPAWWDRGAEALRDLIFSGKFNSMFSMLFAVGFTLQLERLERDEPARALTIYLRRIGWLWVFGVIHACLFWTGDVLHIYAILGIVLLLLRRVSDRWLWILFGACLLYPAAIGLYRLATVTPADTARKLALLRVWEASNNAAYGTGSFAAAAAEHTREMGFSYSEPFLVLRILSFYAQLVATLTLGMILGRKRFFQQTGEHLAAIGRAQLGFLGLGLLTGAVFSVWRFMRNGPGAPTVSGVIAEACYDIGRVSITAFYVATIIRAVHHDAWRRRLAPIAKAGRLPLTNYLMQTLIATFIFYGWGLGYWGKVGPALDLVISIAIFFAIQVPLSRLWLQHFELGPMEHLWRRLTYGRPVAKLERVEGKAPA
jgi:uncharacterized protein